MWLLELFIVIFLLGGVIGEDPLVTIKNGKIKGLVSKTPRKNMTFYAFIGIPYAKPPLGTLRFQPPQPANNWNGVLDATKLNKVCYQTDQANPYETEDCLYLSVITPSIGPNAKLPVLLHIHGGAFVHGHGIFGQSQPQLTIEQEVIVVSINYRLGPFGFLSTGDLVVPGNMGLKDQQLAIRWVHENIQAFGGDPTKVTLTGQSAGGASVTYQLLSQANQGLFRAAIANSGSTLCEWAYQRHHLESAYGIAQMINSSITRGTSTRDLVNFLQKVDAKAIDKTGTKYGTWSPVMEVQHNGAFFTKSMYEMVEKGEIVKVPLLIGINSEECISWVKDLNTFQRNMGGYDRNPYLLVNEDMYITDTGKRSTVGKEIKSIYTNTTFSSSPGPSVRYITDDTFSRAIIKYSELQSAFTDVYFYQFSYHGQLGQNNMSVPGIGYGVAHAEDQRYAWANFRSRISAADLLIVDRYVTLMTNFAKTLNPTPTPSDLFQKIIWPKVSRNNFRYLNIDTNMKVETNPRAFSYSKWVQLWEKEARKPFISF